MSQPSLIASVSYPDTAEDPKILTLHFARSTEDPKVKVVATFGWGDQDAPPDALSFLTCYDGRSMKSVDYSDFPARPDERTIGGEGLWEALYDAATGLELSVADSASNASNPEVASAHSAAAQALTSLAHRLHDQSESTYKDHASGALYNRVIDKDCTSLTTIPASFAMKECAGHDKVLSLNYLLRNTLERRLSPYDTRGSPMKQLKQETLTTVFVLTAADIYGKRASDVLGSLILDEPELRRIYDSLPVLDADETERALHRPLYSCPSLPNEECWISVEAPTEGCTDPRPELRLVGELLFPSNNGPYAPDCPHSTKFLNSTQRDGYERVAPDDQSFSRAVLASLAGNFFENSDESYKTVSNKMVDMFADKKTVGETLGAVDSAVKLGTELHAIRRVDGAVDKRAATYLQSRAASR